MDSAKTKFAYFGSSRLSVIVLDELNSLGYVPSVIVTTIDKPVGRKQILTPNEVKVWGTNHNILVLDPAKLNDEFINNFKGLCQKDQIEVYLVASYSKIIPKALVNLPQKGILNIHPSLLPKYRGPSPLGSAILNDDKETGVCLMKIDEEMDHGPIVSCEKVHIDEWPVYEDYEEMMAKIGANLFAQNIEKYMRSEINLVEQNHSEASYTKKFTKDDGKIDLSATPRQNWLKYCAFHQWPQIYFIWKNKDRETRVKITDAIYSDDKFIIKKVIPEGSNEMDYEDFLRGYRD